jgi:hypothetical protein
VRIIEIIETRAALLSAFDEKKGNIIVCAGIYLMLYLLIPSQ